MCRGLTNLVKNTHSSTLDEVKIHCISSQCDMPTTHDITCSYKMRRPTHDSERHTKWQRFTLFLFPRDMTPCILVAEY